MPAPKKVSLMATGETVKENVRRLREGQNLTYAALSRRLDEIGRPIATLGLTRIEAGERRVDSDDLVALALALRTTPAYLLMPDTPDEDDTVESTAIAEVSARDLWDWLVSHRAGDPMSDDLPALVDFKYQRPAWTRKEGSRESEEQLARLLQTMRREPRGDD